LSDWYVYQHDGDPLGPWTTHAVAEAILAGKLAPDVWVAAPGGRGWLRALDVPVIGALVEGVPTKPRRDSGLRIIPGAFTTDAGQPDFGSTMMIVKDDELQTPEDPATTRKGPAPLRDTTEMPERPAMSVRETTMEIDEPTTDRQLPLPPSSTPTPPRGVSTATAEPRRRKNG
jgi:hypothetical protein